MADQAPEVVDVPAPVGEEAPAEVFVDNESAPEQAGGHPPEENHEASGDVAEGHVPGEAADIIAAGAARAAALAAQFAQGHEGDDHGNKRKHDGEGDEPYAKRAVFEGMDPPAGLLGADGEVTEVVMVPNEKVGKLIGRAGATIKDLQARGMSRIKIDHNASGDHKPVSVTGTRENVDRTKQLIHEALESEAAPAQGDVTRSVSCPAGIVGRIIGRGGETIRSLQTASGAHIMVNQNFPEGHPRQVDISGKPDAVERAFNMVNELISSDGGGSTQTIIQKFGLGVTRVIDCPKPMVGRVIGKGGETIKSLQKQFSASIQIDQNATPCKITITGPAQAVHAAERAILDVIDGNDGRGPGGGPGGFPGGPRPPYPAPYPPYGGYPAPAFGGYSAPPYGGYGAAPGYSGYPGYGAQQPAYGGYGGYGGGSDPYAGGGYNAPAAGSGAGAGGASAGGGGYGASGAAAAAPQSGGSSVWQELRDDQQRVYYYNSQTGVSQWEKPAEMQ
uniref:WW domain-containing protein n=2 Tax=Chlamydomonas chlamydogama TaxID=225041 RepID=A0A7S2QUF9_9CHLO|mmetsp:Transcript_247/g.455  ORF Transcript_247/g.455 Transcript_247/m.455 type:complete len:503 (+) Transcript_247:68-1576(+)|eukprot:CAMPEP_0202901264 /NCGR_PEP_ID=MMETSP1392-20130828/14156_1 /ASSEMBLY_ACC=CAM_ASM_000868 /TAXON_ID=225041 /ORGANISM="Chlamydomonas chlamydogama, Strain SAG 11-48b" /LENGTH=502 /DNA_ID=CAMNT_0049587807 /DNA_START=60 /DNA_END=1568 /DNA_ORIENTATION=-